MLKWISWNKPNIQNDSSQKIRSPLYLISSWASSSKLTHKSFWVSFKLLQLFHPMSNFSSIKWNLLRCSAFSQYFSYFHWQKVIQTFEKWLWIEKFKTLFIPLGQEFKFNTSYVGGYYNCFFIIDPDAPLTLCYPTVNEKPCKEEGNFNHLTDCEDYVKCMRKRFNWFCWKKIHLIFIEVETKIFHSKYGQPLTVIFIIFEEVSYSLSLILAIKLLVY